MKLFQVQSCMTLTDMRLTEFMGLTEKSAMTKLFIYSLFMCQDENENEREDQSFR